LNEDIKLSCQKHKALINTEESKKKFLEIVYSVLKMQI